MKGLHNISKAKNSQRTRKRVGRGDSSGKGKYSGRGQKGQRSRSGGKKGLVARSMKSYLMRIPKTRGFNADSQVYNLVNLDDLQKHFTDGAQVTLKQLRIKKLIDIRKPTKVLARGKISRKLTVSAHIFSEAAKQSIKKAGGTVQVIARAGRATKPREKNSKDKK